MRSRCPGGHRFYMQGKPFCDGSGKALQVALDTPCGTSAMPRSLVEASTRTGVGRCNNPARWGFNSAQAGPGKKESFAFQRPAKRFNAIPRKFAQFIKAEQSAMCQAQFSRRPSSVRVNGPQQPRCGALVVGGPQGWLFGRRQWDSLGPVNAFDLVELVGCQRG